MTTRTRVAVGSVVAVFGLLLAAAGVTLLIVFGRDGTVSGDTHPVATQASALVADLDDIDGVNDLTDVVGTQRLRLSVSSEREVFLAVGPAAQVDAYLAAVDRDEVTDVETDPFRLTTRHRSGGVADDPRAQTFWTATASGRSAQLDWTIRDGDYRIVLMNADASRAIATQVRVAVTLPAVYGLGIGLAVAGSVMIAGAAVLIVSGARRARAVA